MCSQTLLWMQHCKGGRSFDIFSQFPCSTAEKTEDSDGWSDLPTVMELRWDREGPALSTILANCIFQRWRQPCLPSHILFFNVTLPPFHQEVDLFLHLLESGMMLWLLWPIDYGWSDTVPGPGVALHGLAVFLLTSWFAFSPNPATILREIQATWRSHA